MGTHAERSTLKTSCGKHKQLLLLFSHIYITMYDMSLRQLWHVTDSKFIFVIRGSMYMLHLRIVRALAKVAVSRACFLSNTVKFPGLVLIYM